MSKRRVPWTLIVIALLFLVGYVAVHFSPSRRFFRQYGQIRIGMTESQLVELFRRPPDCVCGYRSTRILYFSRGGFFDNKPENCPPEVREKTEIPHFYGSAEIFLGPSGLVRAFACYGEDTKIHTVFGDLSALGIDKLDDSVLEGLCRDTIR